MIFGVLISIDTLLVLLLSLLVAIILLLSLLGLRVHRLSSSHNDFMEECQFVVNAQAAIINQFITSSNLENKSSLLEMKGFSSSDWKKPRPPQIETGSLILSERGSRERRSDRLADYLAVLAKRSERRERKASGSYYRKDKPVESVRFCFR